MSQGFALMESIFVWGIFIATIILAPILIPLAVIFLFGQAYGWVIWRIWVITGIPPFVIPALAFLAMAGTIFLLVMVSERSRTAAVVMAKLLGVFVIALVELGLFGAAVFLFINALAKAENPLELLGYVAYGGKGLLVFPTLTVTLLLTPAVLFNATLRGLLAKTLGVIGASAFIIGTFVAMVGGTYFLLPAEAHKHLQPLFP